MSSFGKFDPDDAVREGWARDPEDEVSFDGYNAFLQITTADGSSGFSVTNAIGATAFKVKSDGDGYVAKNLGIGKTNPTEKLDIAGTAKIEGFQLVTDPTDGYVLTADGSGVGTWQPTDKTTVTDLEIKADTEIAANFSGNPKSVTVNFVIPYTDTDYSVNAHAVVTSNAAFQVSVQNKTVSSFEIHLGTSNISKLIQVDWSAIPYGE